MKKTDVLKAIDEVMNNREIDSIRNAILAIRDKIIALDDEKEDFTNNYTAKLKLRGNDGINLIDDYFDGAKYVCIDTNYKIDTGIYGAYWYE